MLLKSEPDPEILTSMNGSMSRSSSPQEEIPHDNEALDDVWGDSAPSTPSLLPSLHTPAQHPSDIPRLQQEHESAGYRDGITAAKAGSAQAGFDEGFGLGAVLGARTGRVLGILEGIARASPGDGRAQGLWEDAQRELEIVRVFGPEYWTGEGVWKYEVTTEGGEVKKEDEIVFADVAGAHPLVRKWEAVLGEEARRWGVDLEVHEGWEEVRAGDKEVAVQPRESVASVKEKKALDW